MTASTKRPRGRPTVAAADKAKRLEITLPPDLLARLKACPDGPSRTIARLVRDFL